MVLFWQIFFGNILLLFVLITVHEFGHWTMGSVAGIPLRDMRIRLFTFPQQVVLRDGDAWISVSDYQRYWSIVRRCVPSRAGQYLYVVGGFLFETVFIAVLAIGLAAAGHLLFAAVAVGVSLLMYIIYLLAMDIPQSRATGQPWGDTSILYTIAPRATVTVVAAMILVRVGLGTVFLASLA